MVSQNSTTFTNVATIVKINRLSMQNLFRSNHWRSSIKKKDVLQNFAKFTGKHLCQSLSFNKVAGLSLK